MMNDDRTSPATKGDLLDLREEVAANLQALKAELTTSLHNIREESTANFKDVREEHSSSLVNLKDELIEAIRDGQTEVLRAFYGFSQTVQARFLEQDQTEAGIIRRMGTLETRVLEIERRLNIPPSAI